MIIKLLYLLYHSFKKFERVLNYRIAISAGMKVGENRLFVGLQHFGTERYLIKFGKNCLITDGVRFITHDGFIQVPLVEKGESVAVVYSKKSTFGKIIDVNNVFIGISTILMPNIEIGDNSFIAASSVVKGGFREGVVLDESLAKIICTINQYYNKNHHIISFSKNSNGRNGRNGRNIIISRLKDI